MESMRPKERAEECETRGETVKHIVGNSEKGKGVRKKEKVEFKGDFPSKKRKERIKARKFGKKIIKGGRMEKTQKRKGGGYG